ncbi:MAG TPA: hypothetical protein VKU60_17290 [Chloroflexota bacterium]|nr:hypothetical protein [Chloroflexota bacterium]
MRLHVSAYIARRTEILDFQREGLGLNVKPLAIATPTGAQFSMSVSIGLINKAPHPNAARIFLSWLLSREGQSLYAKTLGQNSRRLDVNDGPQDMRPNPNEKLPPSVNQEVNIHSVNRAKDIAKEVLG